MSGFPRMGTALHWVCKPGCGGSKAGGDASLGKQISRARDFMGSRRHQETKLLCLNLDTLTPLCSGNPHLPTLAKDAGLYLGSSGSLL